MALAELKALRNEMEKCFRCSLCKMVPLPVVKHPRFTDACPASRHFHFHGYSTSGKQIMALALLDGRVEPDRAMAEIVFACTTCGYGDVACKFIMDAERQEVNMALRRHLVEEGLGPRAHQERVDGLLAGGQPAGRPERSPGAWAEGLGLKVLPRERAEVLLFAGCAQRADGRAAATARKLARLLLHAGVDAGILGDEESCCGLPAYWTGHGEAFSRIARETADRLTASGARTVVTVSGSCLGAFRSKYPGAAGARLAPRVVHATELLDELLAAGSLTFPRPVAGAATYHDPCYLGRQSDPPPDWAGEEKTAFGCMTYTEPPKPVNRGTNGVFDPPRRILARIGGLAFREMYRIREYAFCCGGGGGVPEAYPQLAASAALHRLEEARAVGASILVSACSHCEANLSGAGAEAGPGSPRVVDIIDLAFEASGLEA